MNHLQLFRRFVVPLMLITVLAGMLPARSARARAATLAAGTAVNVPAGTVRDILWVPTAQVRVATGQSPELAAFVLVLGQLYRENPALAPATAAQKIRALESIYNASRHAHESNAIRTAHESLFAVFAALTDAPLSASPAGPAVLRAARQAFTLTLG